MSLMALSVRPLSEDDVPAVTEMSRIAFGTGPRTSASGQRAPAFAAGVDRYGVLDDGTLLAKVGDRHQDYWYGGSVIPGTGVSGVVVVPEFRGQGLAQLIVGEALRRARDRGALVAALFRTAPALYRRLGFEQAGSLTLITFPTGALTRLRVPAGMTVRPATPADLPAIAALYRRIAQEGNGMIDRRPPLYDMTAPTWPENFDGVTLATGRGGEVDGYVCWQRGLGWETGTRLTVPELHAVTGDATTALLAFLGSWSSVTAEISVQLPQDDPALLLMPAPGAQISSTRPFMIRLLDASAAIRARGFPPHCTGSIDLDVADELLPHNAGRFRLSLDSGQGRLVPGGDGGTSLTIGGLSLLFASAAGPAVLRRAGFLSGGSTKGDQLLQSAFSGPRPTIADFF